MVKSPGPKLKKKMLPNFEFWDFQHGRQCRICEFRHVYKNLLVTVLDPASLSLALRQACDQGCLRCWQTIPLPQLLTFFFLLPTRTAASKVNVYLRNLSCSGTRGSGDGSGVTIGWGKNGRIMRHN